MTSSRATRRRFLSTAAAAAGLAGILTGLVPIHAHAQAGSGSSAYPNKPIRLVVTFPPGGAPDILARLFSEKSTLGQSVVVDNKPGAGGNIGADFVAKSPADGHTLVLATVGTHAINGSLYSKMPYDMVRDFAPVGHIASAPNLLVVTNNLPVRNVAEFIAYLRPIPTRSASAHPASAPRCMSAANSSSP